MLVSVSDGKIWFVFSANEGVETIERQLDAVSADRISRGLPAVEVFFPTNCSQFYIHDTQDNILEIAESLFSCASLNRLDNESEMDYMTISDSEVERLRSNMEEAVKRVEQLENQQETASQLPLEDTVSSNRRIAKNTVLLYIRMIVMMLIGLYTSRVVIQSLGVDDFGIYNAVGGVVAMFAILSSSLSTAVSRYLTFELGRGDKERLKTVFSTSLNVQFVIAAVVVVVGLVIGLWFINYKMNMPPGRESAASWVLYCSLASFAVGLISVPYNASIISHEKMNVFAYMTIFDATAKLGVAFAISASPIDRLKTYSVLLLGVALLNRYIYAQYCVRHFSECKYKFVHNPSLVKEMTSFAGWNFFGNTAWILNTQGISLLINVFFGVALNAARGIGNQVDGLAQQFVINFMTALNPQITKLYASGNLPKMHQLVCSGAKFSFFLTMLFAIPCCLETPKILSVWLGVVPDYAVTFVRLTFVSSMVTVLGNTLVTAQLATGKIRRYQIIMTLVGFWVFPLTWIAYKLGGGPEWTYYIFCVVYFGLIFVRIYLVKDLIHMPWMLYIREVIFKSIVVLVVAVIAPLLLYLLMPDSILRVALVVFISFISSGIVIYWIGLHKDERQSVKHLLLDKVLHR